MNFKDLIAIVVLSMPCTACVILAGYLCAHGVDGWGWFLFIGLLLGGGSYRSTKESEIRAKADLERAKLGLPMEEEED